MRLNRNFLYFSLISTTLFLTNNVFLFLYINAIKTMILFVPLIIRYVRWGKNSANKVPRRMKMRVFIPIIVAILIVSYSLSLLTVDFDKYPLLDSLNLVFALTGVLLQVYGYIEGFIFSIVTAIIVIYMMAESSAWTVVVTASLYLITTIATILAWLSIYHEQHNTFKYRPPIHQLQETQINEIFHQVEIEKIWSDFISYSDKK
ncbi:MAG: hypothetical protein GQ557_02320 [Mycoplasmataceae bacterium]|nr:hypothetical protein [Mycoplasmataceae bacterium]